MLCCVNCLELYLGRCIVVGGALLTCGTVLKPLHAGVWRNSFLLNKTVIPGERINSTKYFSLMSRRIFPLNEYKTTSYFCIKHARQQTAFISKRTRLYIWACRHRDSLRSSIQRHSNLSVQTLTVKKGNNFICP